MSNSNFNDLSAEHQEIVRAIGEGRPVSDEQANWAVKMALATQGEDGDIDLTQKGRHLLG